VLKLCKLSDPKTKILYSTVRTDALLENDSSMDSSTGSHSALEYTVVRTLQNEKKREIRPRKFQKSAKVGKNRQKLPKTAAVK
jgi:hypothetical protein